MAAKKIPRTPEEIFKEFLIGFKKRSMRIIKECTYAIVGFDGVDRINLYKMYSMESVKLVVSYRNADNAKLLQNRLIELGAKELSDSNLPYALFNVSGFDFYTITEKEVQAL